MCPPTQKEDTEFNQLFFKNHNDSLQQLLKENSFLRSNFGELFAVLNETIQERKDTVLKRKQVYFGQDDDLQNELNAFDLIKFQKSLFEMPLDSVLNRISPL